jgi:hypothetical protein
VSALAGEDQRSGRKRPPEPKPVAEAPVAGVPDAVGRAEVPRIEVPGAAANYPDTGFSAVSPSAAVVRRSLVAVVVRIARNRLRQVEPHTRLSPVWASPCQAQISPSAHLSICSVPLLGRTPFHSWRGSALAWPR